MILNSHESSYGFVHSTSLLCQPCMIEPIAWINGVHCPFSQAAVPVWDMGVVAGAAVTEMARTYRHRPFRLDKHVQATRELTARTEFFPSGFQRTS